MNWLFLDLNSYFASVEQQESPALRGKPLAVVPVQADTTCCIAASYEAKAFGIKTGTMVREAKALCPRLQLIEARPEMYVSYHQKIRAAVESCVPVDKTLSIDEMICRLTGRQRELEEAVALARKIKRTISSQVGPYLRCSIGLAPNRFLAKVAGDIQKPDGLTLIRMSVLPQVLYPLDLRDLPGIGPKMEERLKDEGITSVRQLTAASRRQMHQLWGSIEGDRFYAWLRGQDTPEPAHERYSIGHSHVLEPSARTRDASYQVVKHLTGKAALRLRQEGVWTSGMVLVIQYTSHQVWEGKVRLAETQDTPTLLKALAQLWQDVPARKPLSVSVTLHPLIPRRLHNPTFFDNPKREQAASVVDALNERLGKNTVYFASLQESRDKAPTRIAFTRIPDSKEF